MSSLSGGAGVSTCSQASAGIGGRNPKSCSTVVVVVRGALGKRVSVQSISCGGSSPAPQDMFQCATLCMNITTLLSSTIKTIFIMFHYSAHDARKRCVYGSNMVEIVLQRAVLC